MAWIRVSTGLGHEPPIGEKTSSSKFGLTEDDGNNIFRRLQSLLFDIFDELEEAENATDIWSL